ncbi:MAG: sodium/proline symporter [Bacteroidales bacterium]|jgi:sodium/proline symporter|nr:sodium/proline symporter [Bacteroidales bacterium]MDN5330292.1 sodium/proline symporter [Bacteroidales bacterium]
MSWTLAGFIIYLIVILIVGFLTYRRNENEADYFLAGRKLNPWVVAFSERASGESAWLILGLPGAAMAMGFLEIWTALGCVLGIIFYWYVIASRIRINTESVGAITLPEFLARSFPEGARTIRLLSTLIIIFFFTFYLSAQFNGAGKVLEVTFGIPKAWGMAIGAWVIIIYTMLGGFFAVAWTDFIQGAIMFATLVILPLAGLSEILQNGSSLGEAVSQAGTEYWDIAGGKTGWAGIATVISGLSWAFGYMGQPHLLTRFMSIKDPKKIAMSRRIAFIWAIPAFTGAVLIGLCGLTLYGKNYFSDIEHVMPYMANTLLPSWLAGILISGSIAAMMSTADSQLLLTSSAVAEDLCHRVLGIAFTQKQMLFFSRMVTLGVGIIAFVIAITSSKLIFTMVSYAWSGLGASFGPALLLMLWWKKTTAKGIIAGMITGALTTIIWSELPGTDEWLSVRFVSFVLALVMVWLVSYLTKKTKPAS